MRAHVVAVTAAALMLTSCRNPEVTIIPRSELPEDVYGSPAARPGPPPGIPSRGHVYLTRQGHLVRVPRPLPLAGSHAEALLSALLEGPVHRAGLGSAIPIDTRLIDLELESGVATVDLSSEFERGAEGTLLALRVAQVVYTLTEVPEVLAVVFFVEGNHAPVLTGDGRLLERPVTRRDYSDLAPPPEEGEATPSPEPAV